MSVLWVKGSGGDLGSMQLDGFATLYLDKLLQLEPLYRGRQHEDEMVALLPHCTFDLNPRAASIDTPLHALLPFDHVDHVHPDAVIALAASSNGEKAAREIYGDQVGWIPWQRPGFDLGVRLRKRVEASPRARGVILAGHGLVCWGRTSKDCYDNTIDLIGRAVEYLNARFAGSATFGGSIGDPKPPEERRRAAASLMPRLRSLLTGGRSKIGHFSDDVESLEFVGSRDFARLAGMGTSCPDHFLRTKIVPLTLDPGRIDDEAYLAHALQTYRDSYQAYYGRCATAADPPIRDAESRGPAAAGSRAIHVRGGQDHRTACGRVLRKCHQRDAGRDDRGRICRIAGEGSLRDRVLGVGRGQVAAHVPSLGLWPDASRSSPEAREASGSRPHAAC